jgi:succinyl-diaminopimelate desuccinylase
MIASMNPTDAVSLTRSLLQFDTINPPGRERECARSAGAMLEQWGYRVEYEEFAEGRTSVIARAGGSDAKSPLVFTGHLDVVPLGTRKWSREPFAGETDGDKLYGRGSSDMKAGVAAMLIAARTFGGKLDGTPGITLVLTSGEEGGCIGSKHLATLPDVMGRAGAMIVGEPTSNYPLVGHKGSLKFHASFRGISAHGSMPHLGKNAVYAAARAVSRLEEFSFDAKPHPIMGEPTMNVGTFEGGSGVNLVPDLATIGVDIRTVPGMDHAALIERLREVLGKEAELEVFSNLNAVWTAPDAEWVQRVFEICKPVVGEPPQARTAPYMTDAANLLKVYKGAPTVVLGPGEAAMAHQTDEYCSVERIRESVALYEEIIRDWCRTSR